ncbi:protein lev-9, partial [Trichonephila clavata]
LGRTITPGSTVHVSCDAGYSFQGKGWNDVSVRCSLGEWDKDPACLTTGSVYNKKAESSSDELAVGRTGFMNTTKGSEIETVQPVSTDVPSSEQTVSEDLKPAFNVSNTFQSSCYCTYTNQDATLAAYAGTDLLHVGSRVKSNCTVKFHCYQTGYARLSGPTEIQCQNCQWTTVKFPVCLQPQIGETTFQIVSPYMLLPGGIIGIEKGKSLIINCYSNGYESFHVACPKDIDHFTLTNTLCRGHSFDI